MKKTELPWLKVEDYATKLSREDSGINTANDLLQLCIEGKLKLSHFLFKRRAITINKYSPLSNSGIYQYMAKKIISYEEKKKTFKIYDPLSKKEGVDTFFNGKIEDPVLIRKRKIDVKAEELFVRWKQRGIAREDLEYGEIRKLDGIFEIHVDKEMSDYLIKIVLKYEKPELKQITVISSNNVHYQLVNKANKPESYTLRIDDLVVKKEDRIEYEENYLEEHSVKPSKAGVSSNKKLPKWEDLFIRIRNSPDFRFYLLKLNSFIQENEELPQSPKELFDFIKEDGDNHLVLPSRKLVSRDNFRNNWNTYTRKYDKKPI